MGNVRCAGIKKDGSRCDAWAVQGYRYCTAHGGPVPSRNFYGRGTMTTGSGSSFPIVRLAASYNKMLSDGRVLSNRAAIDIIDKRVMQLLERIDENESPERLKNLYKLWAKYTEALDNRKEIDVITTRIDLDKEFEKVYHDYAAWQQTFEALALRRTMTESEVKALKEIKAIMTAEDAYELVAKLLSAVMRVNGDDPRKLKQVQYEFTRIIGESSDRVAQEPDQDDWGGGGEEGGGEGLSDVDQAELPYPGNET